MMISCAWCGKTMGYKESFDRLLPATHSICPDCLAAVEAEFERATGRKLTKEAGE